MPSRVVARKAARLIPILPGEEPYFNPRGDIPVNSGNTLQASAGLYRAKLTGIVPIVNRASASVGGISETHIYAWVYRTLRARDHFMIEDGVDEEGEAFEFVFYTGVDLGDPVASLTKHVGDMVSEVPDPDVLEAVGLSKMLGSRVCICVKHGRYAVPSLKSEIPWYGDADHLRKGLHMVGIATGVLISAKPQSGWREEWEARERERSVRAQPSPTMVLRITDVEDE